MKRLILIAHCEVYGVGYRDKVQKIALKSKITGQVKNFDDLTVEIVAEGRDEDLSLFIEAIQIYEFPIFVEDLDIKEEQYSGEFTGFKIIRGTRDEEIIEGLDSIILYLARIDKNYEAIARNLSELSDAMEDTRKYQ